MKNKLLPGLLLLFVILIVSTIMGVMKNVEAFESKKQDSNQPERKISNPLLLDEGEIRDYNPNDMNTSYNNNGIAKSNIPEGDEDLYILKSEIVPPVCPACPSSSVCPKEKKCEPCPPCARCPEPAFECKKVPNYSVGNNSNLPLPVLNDFSQFGR